MWFQVRRRFGPRRSCVHLIWDNYVREFQEVHFAGLWGQLNADGEAWLMWIFTHVEIYIYKPVAKSSNSCDDLDFCRSLQQEEIKFHPDAHIEGSLGWDSGVPWTINPARKSKNWEPKQDAKRRGFRSRAFDGKALLQVCAFWHRNSSIL